MNTFKDFYNRQRQKVFAYLIRRAGDYHLACDILQESFTRTPTPAIGAIYAAASLLNRTLGAAGGRVGVEARG